MEVRRDHKYFGQVKYDIEGNPICYFCEKGFPRLMTHVRQIHGVTARQYKITFGLSLKRGIMSESARAQCRDNVFKNSERVVHNILIYGEPTRFKKGEAIGRPRFMWSEQDIRRLIQHNKTMRRRT